MKKSIFKPIIAGILTGAVLFMFGFLLLRIVLFFLIIGAIFRFFIKRRFRSNFNGRPNSFRSHRYNGMEIINIRDYKTADAVSQRSKGFHNIINID